MNALCISGAAFKIPFLAGAVVKALDRIDYQVYAGVSSGALIAATLATNTFKHEGLKIILTFDESDVFKQNPNTKWGKLKAALRTLSGKSYLFDQSKLRDTIKSIITKSEFYKYSSSLHAKSCYIGCVNEADAKQHFIDIKSLKYEHAIEVILASSSLPVLTQAVPYQGMSLVDGGVRSHIPSPWIAKNVDGLSHITSIYSRPREFDQINWSSTNKSLARGLVSRLLRVISILSWEVSKYDEHECDTTCEEKSITQVKVFAPHSLLQKLYDVEDNHDKLFELGKVAFSTGYDRFNSSRKTV